VNWRPEVLTPEEKFASDKDPVKPRFREAVLCMVVDGAAQFVCMLQKRSGPPNLIGKWNFPGGKVEANETDASAATREFKEETGVLIQPGDWRRIVGFEWDSGNPETSFRIAVMRAVSDKLNCVRTVEKEPVGVFPVNCLPEPVSPQLGWILQMAYDRDILTGNLKIIP
jgi:8-oxo-dGTP pyrophosphatase MutT (NUDIX family)